MTMSFKKVISKLLYGGTSSLKPLERGLIKSVCGAVTKDVGEILCKQMEMVSLVQRDHGNRMIMMFFNDQNIPVLGDVRENLCLAKITYQIGSEKFKTNLFVHRGKLSSLETNKSLSQNDLRQSPEHPDITVCFSKEEGLASSLDKKEHSREEPIHGK